MRMRAGRRADEQDASEQELQRMVAELKQQAAAVTAGGSDATASGS
jgi:HAMP domain-containing protein